MVSIKQYRLYNLKLKKLITARDAVFHEDSAFYKPLEQQIICPVSTYHSIVSVSQSTREDTDFDPGLDDVETLSSNDFDYATDEEEEGEPKHSGESQCISFEEVRREPEQVVKKTPKSRAPGQMANTLGSYWRGSASGLRPIRRETGGEGRSNEAMSIDLALLVADVPRTIMDTLDGPNRTKWIEAINSKLMSLEEHKTWSMVEEGKIPKDAWAISSRMVLQEKIGEDGKVARYKARLVAHGFRQRAKIHYSETYSL